MKKTFFTLLQGTKVKVAPETKIIHADEISTLLEASEIVDRIKGEGDALKQQIQQECEQIRKKVAAEAEQIKKQAYAEGFKQGQDAWVKAVAKLEEQTQRVHSELKEMVIPVALQAAKKIVGREMTLSKDTIVDIIANNLRAVATHKRIVLYVNKNDYDVFEANKPRLKELFERLESLVVQERNDVQPNGCIIETEAGIINAQLDNQWEMLQKAFESVMKSKLDAIAVADDEEEDEEEEDEE
ncbi:MAG: HrpE/YscL family type III secretion apparatus protein [Chlamydiia bacterium]|nr:HrpE/YscL family type III secretion apparatus protein [Chlamydiia bacterium]